MDKAFILAFDPDLIQSPLHLNLVEIRPRADCGSCQGLVNA